MIAIAFRRSPALLLPALLFCMVCRAQNNKPITFDLQAMLADHSLQPVNRTASPITEGASIKGIHLNEVDGQGIAWLGKTEFSNGVIEFDVRGKDELQHSFVGIAFHGINDSTFDAVYLRPFNFRATDPQRKIHMVQYISMPAHDWNFLRTNFPGKYEKPITPAPDPGAWVHVRIVVAGKKIGVYIDHSNTSSLEVEQLENLGKGKIGLWAGHTSGGDWANITVVPAP
jgi:hypothetical protein